MIYTTIVVIISLLFHTHYHFAPLFAWGDSVYPLPFRGKFLEKIFRKKKIKEILVATPAQQPAQNKDINFTIQPQVTTIELKVIL